MRCSAKLLRSGAPLIRDRHRAQRFRVCSAPLRAALRPGHERATRDRNLLGRLFRRLNRLLGAAVILLLADACGFAAQAALIVELGAAHPAAAHELDRLDHRRIERKDALHALAVGDFADRETLIEPAARARDADALIALYARALALDHLDVDEHRVARRKVRDVLARGEFCNLLFLELLNQIHGNSPAAALIA